MVDRLRQPEFRGAKPCGGHSIAPGSAGHDGSSARSRVLPTPPRQPESCRARPQWRARVERAPAAVRRGFGAAGSGAVRSLEGRPWSEPSRVARFYGSPMSGCGSSTSKSSRRSSRSRGMIRRLMASRPHQGITTVRSVDWRDCARRTPGSGAGSSRRLSWRPPP